MTSTLVLYTHLHVREDELSLYGCASEDEVQLFKQLLSVSGVGPKVGLAMLSRLSADDIRVAIVSEQADVLSSVPGIGARTAKKVILDLKDKVKVPDEPGHGVAFRPELVADCQVGGREFSA